MVGAEKLDEATFYQAPYAQRCAPLSFMVGNDLFNDEKSDTRNVSSLPIYKKDLTFPRVWFLIKWTNKIFYGTKAYCLLSKEALSWKRKFLYSRLLFLVLKN